MLIRALTVSAAVAAAPLALCQPLTDSLTYQGELTDGGTAADGVYDFEVSVHDAQVGGTTIATDSIIGVSVEGGRFTLDIDFMSTGQVFETNQRLWLELRVRGGGNASFDTLTPRQAIALAPSSNYALRSGTTLQDAFDNAPGLDLGSSSLAVTSSGGAPVLEIGPPTGGPGNAGFLVLNNTNGTPVVSLGVPASNAGELIMSDNSGNRNVQIQQDINIGGGTFARFMRNDSEEPAFTIDGNYDNTQAPRVTITSETMSMLFDASTAGNDSVVLPVNSIGSAEILNEAGVAEYEFSASEILSADPGVVDLIGATTITAPADGNVLVIASCVVRLEHVNGAPTDAVLGVSPDLTLTGNRDIDVTLDPSFPTGTVDIPFSTHGVFPVTAGTHTFNFLGDQNTTDFGQVRARDIQLSAVYLPSAYGNVFGARANEPDDRTSSVARRIDRLTAERIAAVQAENARQQRELDLMREQMARIRAEVKASR